MPRAEVPLELLLPPARRAGRGEARATMHALLAVESDTCIIWPFGRTSDGYGQVRWYGPTSRGRMTRTHIIACEHHHGPKPSDEHEVAHGCGQPLCMNYRHIRWATPTENQADKLQHDGHIRGERSGTNKLTRQQVQAIRDEYAAGGVSQQAIADRYEVSQFIVSSIIRRTRWAWFDGETDPTFFGEDVRP